jgi:hypothetical protein
LRDRRAVVVVTRRRVVAGTGRVVVGLGCVVGAAVVVAWTVVVGASLVTVTREIEVTVTVRCSPAPAVPSMAPGKNVAVATTQVRRHHGGLPDGGLGGGGAPQLLGGRCGGTGGPQPGWGGWPSLSPPGPIGRVGTIPHA